MLSPGTVETPQGYGRDPRGDISAEKISA